MSDQTPDDLGIPDDYEKVSESRSRDGTRIMFVKRKSDVYYNIPEYSIPPESYTSHKETTNWGGMVSFALGFLTLLGAVTASWITMSERMATTETSQKIKFEAFKEALVGVRQDIEINRSNLSAYRRDIDSRLRTIIRSNNDINVRLAKIQSILEGQQRK